MNKWNETKESRKEETRKIGKKKSCDKKGRRKLIKNRKLSK